MPAPLRRLFQTTKIQTFGSNSQHDRRGYHFRVSCFRLQRYKFLKAIHNSAAEITSFFVFAISLKFFVLKCFFSICRINVYLRYKAVFFQLLRRQLSLRFHQLFELLSVRSRAVGVYVEYRLLLRPYLVGECLSLVCRQVVARTSPHLVYQSSAVRVCRAVLFRCGK